MKIFNIKSRCKKRGNSLSFSSLLGIGLFIGLLCLWSSQSHAQCSTVITTLAEFNFNSANYACSGVGRGSTRPRFRANRYFYCPNTSAGCGDIYLGSQGHANTGYFNNAICVLNFYDVATASGYYGGTADYDPSSNTFDPHSPANLYLDYTIPQGSGDCIDNFSVVPVQYMYDGSTLNFEQMGVAVFRNGFLIHTETQNIAASNVNGTPMSFAFTGSQFCADGSQEVNYQVVFGFVKQLVTGGALSPAQTGVDDIVLTGTCSIPSSVGGQIQSVTCLAGGGADSNGKISIYGFNASDKFDFNIGSTYTGSATYASATAIPTDGILTTTLPNPSADATYTVRVINDEGCSIDLILNMASNNCPTPCDEPNSETIVAVDATCAGLVSNDDASIGISGVIDGDKVGLFAGGPYAGPAYASAELLAGGAYSYTALPNPVSNQIYTIRIFNGADDCYVDRTAEIVEFSCGTCSNASIEIMEVNEPDPDSSPANSISSEDDIAIYEACKDDGNIDLELSKNVSPNSGTTADTYVYTLILNNTGTTTAYDIQITEDFPFSVAPTVLSGTLGTSVDSLTITASAATVGTFGLSQGWILDSLQAGQSATLTIDVRALVPGTYVNCAFVTNMFPDNDPDSTDDNDASANEDDDDCATITVTGTSLPIIVKEFSPMLTKPGTPTRLTLKISNTESSPITLTSALTDVFPTSPGQMVVAATPNLVTNLSGLTVNTGDVQVVIPSGTVLPVGLSQIQFDITVPAEGHYCNDIAAGDLQTTSGNNLLPTQACLAAYNSYVIAPVTCVADICINSPSEVTMLVLTIDNRNATNMTLDQDYINYLPAGVTMATGTNTGTIAGVTAFSAGDTSFTLVGGSIIPPGVQTIMVPVTSATVDCYSNIIYMNTLLTTVDGVSNLGNQDIAEPKRIACANPTITARDTTICNGNMVDVSSLASTTGGTLTFHSATPPNAGNILASTIITPTMDSTIYVLATDGACTNTAEIMITHVSNPAITARDTTICNGNMVDMSLLASTTGGALTFHSATPPNAGNALASTTITPIMSTIYVLATDGTCTDAAQIMITHVSNPTITARDTTICNGNMVDVSSLASTTGGTLTFHSATPPNAGNALASTTITPTMDRIIYVLARDGTCTDTAEIMITHSIPDSVMLCSSGSNSATFTAQSGLTGVEWFNSAGTSVGIGDAVTVDANTAGMDDGNDSFYYTAQEGSGCTIGLCCPIVVQTEVCCSTIDSLITDRTICSGGLVDSLAVTTTFSNPDSIAFVYFTSAQTDPYSGGTGIETVQIASSSDTVMLTDISGFTHSGGSTPDIFYVYGIAHPTPTDGSCRPFEEILVHVNPCDWGDLPDVSGATSMDDYQTLRANNGPVHIIIPGLSLGSTIDGETDGQASNDALGDGADEDGLMMFNSLDLVPGQNFRLPFSYTNTTGNTAYVVAWIDWNGDGDFDELSEKVADWNDGITAFPDRMEVTIPSTAKLDAALGWRIRISHQDNMTPYGEQPNGEVEDYLITIACPDICLPIKATIIKQ